MLLRPEEGRPADLGERSARDFDAGYSRGQEIGRGFFGDREGDAESLPDRIPDSCAQCRVAHIRSLFVLQRYVSRFSLTPHSGGFGCIRLRICCAPKRHPGLFGVAPKLVLEWIRSLTSTGCPSLPTARVCVTGCRNWRRGAFMWEGVPESTKGLDQIYTRSRYLTRGRFSRQLFEQSCLEE